MIDLEKLRNLAEDDVKRGREWSTNSRDVLMLLDHIAKLEKDSGRLDYVITQFAIDGIDGLIEFLVDEDGFVLKADKARKSIDTAMESKHG